MASDQIKVVQHDDRLPWLETVEPDDRDGPPAGRVIAMVLLGLALLSALVWAVYRFQNRAAAGIDLFQNDVIAPQVGKMLHDSTRVIFVDKNTIENAMMQDEAAVPCQIDVHDLDIGVELGDIVLTGQRAADAPVSSLIVESSTTNSTSTAQPRIATMRIPEHLNLMASMESRSMFEPLPMAAS